MPRDALCGAAVLLSLIAPFTSTLALSPCGYPPPPKSCSYWVCAGWWELYDYPAGTACSDGNVCTKGDTCDG